MQIRYDGIMKTFEIQDGEQKKILALGAESDGNFSYYDGKDIYFSESFGDLLNEKNLIKFKAAVSDFVQKNGKPEVVISDLHPLFHTTVWAKELAEEFGAEFIQVQHHLAHIFSGVGDSLIQQCHPERLPVKDESRDPLNLVDQIQLRDSSACYSTESACLPARQVGMTKRFIGIACDGIGYGFDGRIWGGEVFLIQNSKFKIQNEMPDVQIKRIGKLENQTLIGGELAIREPARMLISILGKFLNKEEVFQFVKKYYDKNQFELLWNQWKEGFNCLETSSTGRILDAVSVLLGFSENERPYKHAPIDLLEKNSREAYNIEPVIKEADKRSSKNVTLACPEPDIQEKGNKKDSGQARMTSANKLFELQTTELFKYLVQNLDKDKKRLAATAQMYLAKGLWEMVSCHSELDSESKKETRVWNDTPVFFAGGVANNKIISDFLVEKSVIVSQEIPRGDAGISFGQLIYYLANSRD